MIRLTGDSRHLPHLLADNDLGHLVGQVPAVIGSPPYNVAVVGYPSNYKDHLPWPLYNAYAKLWSRAIHDILCPGGRAWVVVQQTVPLEPGTPGGWRVPLANLWMNALSSAGLNYRDIVLWVQDSFDGGTAWGSWCQPSAPNLRGSSELILLYHKGPWHRKPPPELAGQGREKQKKRLQPRDGPGGDWTDLTRNVWKINSANHGGPTKDGRPSICFGPRERQEEARRSILPALYPLDIPRRAIRLSTWPGEWVVDPWAGHCTTGFAADELGRESVMVDLGFDEVQLKEIGERLKKEKVT